MTSGPAVAAPGEPEGAGTLRRRALEAASVAYTAAHGHPLEHPSHGRVRWEVGTRSVVAAAVALSVLVGAVAVRAVVEPSTPPARAEDVRPMVGATGAGDEGDVGGTGDTGGTGVTVDPEDAARGAGHAPPGSASGATPTSPLATPDGPGAHAAGATAEALLVVHVVGAVTEPGVVVLPEGARVADAVEASGGATEAADLGALNLARVLTDGEQVRVPVPGEEVAPIDVPAASGGSGGPAAHTTGGAVDLNRAGADQLESLPGIGPVLAQRIVDHRESRGPFSSVEQLAGVSGIGPKLLAGLRDHVTVGG